MRKRIEISHTAKSKLCLLKARNPKLTIKDLQSVIIGDHGIDIGYSTVSEILKDSDRWSNIEENSSSRISYVKHSDLENALIAWIGLMNSLNGFVNEKIILEKAKKFAVELSIDDMKFSKEWLQKFKKRHNVKKHCLFGEAGSLSKDFY